MALGPTLSICLDIDCTLLYMYMYNRHNPTLYVGDEKDPTLYVGDEIDPTP